MQDLALPLTHELVQTLREGSKTRLELGAAVPEISTQCCTRTIREQVKWQPHHARS